MLKSLLPKRSRRFLVALGIALLVLVAGLPSLFSALKAQDTKTVYVVICVDQEFWGDSGHDAYLGTSDPHPVLDVREYSRTQPMNMAAVFNSSFRNSIKDSFGGEFKMSWFSEMDDFIANANFIWADGSSVNVSGYTAIHDLTENIWGPEIQTFGDDLEYHHHFMVYNETWQRYDNGPDAGYPQYQMDALDHMIIDDNFYPSVWRSGWWIMPDALSQWLNQWMPFDYTPADEGVWYPNHPDGMARWQTRCPYRPDQDSVNYAFMSAIDPENDGYAIYGFCTHDREDMAGQISSLQGYLQTALSTPQFSNVVYKYVTAKEAMQLALGYSGTPSPTFTITPNSGSYTITSSESLWQNNAFVAFKYQDGTYAYVPGTSIGTNKWTVTPPSQTVTETNVAANAQVTRGLPVINVTASNYLLGFAPQNAIDGVDNIYSYWDSTYESVPQWLKLDLGSVQTFSNIRTHFWDGNNGVYTYYIEASNDSSHWTTVVPEQDGSGVMWNYFNPAISARYIRIWVTDNSDPDNPYAQISEVNVGSGSSSIAASSSASGHAPELAIDGLGTTMSYWASAGTLPQWLNVDLRAPTSISKIVTHFYDGDSRTYTYHIDASNDSSTWTPLVTSKTGRGIVTDTLSAAVTARYVNITLTGTSASNKVARIEEIKIYNVATTTLPPLQKIGVGASDLHGNTGTLVKDVSFKFNVTATPLSPVVSAGTTMTYNVTASMVTGPTEPVSWSCTGLPSGATASFNAASGLPTFSSSLKIVTDPSTPPGLYNLNVVGTSPYFSNSTTVQLKVMNFSINSTPFSPDGNGVKDTSTINATFWASLSWSLTIKNGAGTVVRHLATGSGSSLSVTWNGKDDSSVALPDGTYTISLGVPGLTKTGSVVIDRAPPVVLLQCLPGRFSPLSGQNATFTFSLSEKCTVTVQIYNSGAQLVRTLQLPTDRNAGVYSLVWDGKDGSGVVVPAGTYTCRVYASDMAGNQVSPYPTTCSVAVQ